MAEGQVQGPRETGISSGPANQTTGQIQLYGLRRSFRLTSFGEAHISYETDVVVMEREVRIGREMGRRMAVYCRPSQSQDAAYYGQG